MATEPTVTLTRETLLSIFFTGLGTGAKSAIYSLGQSGHAVATTPVEAHHYASNMVSGMLNDPLQRLTLEGLVDRFLNGETPAPAADAIIPPTDGGRQ